MCKTVVFDKKSHFGKTAGYTSVFLQKSRKWQKGQNRQNRAFLKSAGYSQPPFSDPSTPPSTPRAEMTHKTPKSTRKPRNPPDLDTRPAWGPSETPLFCYFSVKVSAGPPPRAAWIWQFYKKCQKAVLWRFCIFCQKRLPNRQVGRLSVTFDKTENTAFLLLSALSCPRSLSKQGSLARSGEEEKQSFLIFLSRGAL